MLFFDVLEVRLHEDFMVNDVVIVDFDNVSLTDMKQLTPSLIYKQVSVYQVSAIFYIQLLSFYCFSLESVFTSLEKCVHCEQSTIHDGTDGVCKNGHETKNV